MPNHVCAYPLTWDPYYLGAIMASDSVQALMRDNRLPDNIVAYMVTTMGVDTLSRAQAAFEEVNLSVQVDAVLTSNGYFPAGTPPQQRIARQVGGDIKQFWREAAEENKIAITRKASRVEEHASGPLPQFAAGQMQTAWMAKQNFELLPAWKLSPNQLGRLGREIERAGLTLWLMHKVKFVPQARNDRTESKVPLGAHSSASLHFGAEELEPEPIVMVSAYLETMWGWLTNLADVGIHARQPDGTRIAAGAPGADLPYCRWDTASHYHYFAKDKATTPLPDGKLPSFQQIKGADEKTRLYWMRLTCVDAQPARVTLNAAILASLTE